MCSLYLLDQHLFPLQTSQTNPIRVSRSPQKEHQSVMAHISKCVQMCMFLCGMVYHCVYWPQTGCQQPSCPTLSLHFSVPATTHSGHFKHFHLPWMAVIVAKLYTHMADGQPLKPHCNITQWSFNDSLTQQCCIKGPSMLLSSEKYSPWILDYRSPHSALMKPFVCRET